MNKICLVGRMGRDPERVDTKSGDPIAKFSIAVNRPFKNQAGEREADWFNCTAFGKRADFVLEYLGKGRLVSVTGRMESRRYEDKNGTMVTAWEVKCDDVNGLDKAPEGQERRTSQVHDAEYDDPFSS